MKSRSALLWVLAVFVAAVTSIYQRVYGPTYPVKGHLDLGGHRITAKLPKSHGGPGDAEIRVPTPDSTIVGILEYRRYRTADAWNRLPMARQNGVLVGHIPHQPLAGKVAYRVLLAEQGPPDNLVPLTDDPVVLRFRGDVHSTVLIPHVIGMILAMIFSARAGLEALVRGPATLLLGLLAAASLLVGGLVLGPVVQKCAFDAWWTGWPLGQDLTDNKTLVAFIIWLVAVWRTLKDRRARGWVLASSLFTLAIWLIPHSMLGSEFDYAPTPP